MSQTILLIEDDPAVMTAHWRVLRRSFPLHAVVTSDSASRAIAVLSIDSGVALIVSDYDLGREQSTGGDVLRWILVHRPALADRFVFLTGDLTRAKLMTSRVMMKGTPIDLMRNYLTGVMAGATV